MYTDRSKILEMIASLDRILGSAATAVSSPSDDLLRVKFGAQNSASSFSASSGQHCITCLFNGLKAYTFTFPGVVRDFISTQV
jgi:hypothetical protein